MNYWNGSDSSRRKKEPTPGRPNAGGRNGWSDKHAGLRQRPVKAFAVFYENTVVVSNGVLGSVLPFKFLYY